MTIKEKLDIVKTSYKYNFVNVDFTIFKEDLVRIYDKVDGICLYSGALLLEEIPEELANKEYKKEELIKMPESHTFAICFYLDAPEKIEKPISARAQFI